MTIDLEACPSRCLDHTEEVEWLRTSEPPLFGATLPCFQQETSEAAFDSRSIPPLLDSTLRQEIKMFVGGSDPGAHG